MKKLFAVLPLVFALAYAVSQHHSPATAMAQTTPAVDGMVATQFRDCRGLFYQQQPPQIPSAVQDEGVRELCFADFAVLHSRSTRSPVFAAEKLSAASLNCKTACKTFQVSGVISVQF